MLESYFFPLIKEAMINICVYATIYLWCNMHYPLPLIGLQVEWCWTSEAVAFVPGFLPLCAYSRIPGTTAMGSTIRMRSVTNVIFFISLYLILN